MGVSIRIVDTEASQYSNFMWRMWWKLTTDKWYVLIDMSMGIIYPCFYRMEQVTRYPLTEFSYDNLDLLTNMKKPCEQIIEMLGDLFIQLKPLLNKYLS